MHSRALITEKRKITPDLSLGKWFQKPCYIHIVDDDSAAKRKGLLEGPGNEADGSQGTVLCEAASLKKLHAV